MKKFWRKPRLEKRFQHVRNVSCMWCNDLTVLFISILCKYSIFSFLSEQISHLCCYLQLSPWSLGKHVMSENENTLDNYYKLYQNTHHVYKTDLTVVKEQIPSPVVGKTLTEGSKYLRVPLYAQARKRPGNPGWSLNMSNTKYGIYWEEGRW